MYGDADDTVSTLKVTVAPVGEGLGLRGGTETLYLNSVELTISLTTNLPLYPDAVIPLISTAVSTAIPPSSSEVVTVITLLVVVPSPALILVMPTSPPVGPTIRNSSIFGWISKVDEG